MLPLACPEKENCAKCNTMACNQSRIILSLNDTERHKEKMEGNGSMNKKTFILISTIIAIVILFGTVKNHAGTKVDDVLKLQNKSYRKHKEGIVIFQHRKHQGEYREKNPKLFNSTCGECHHDDDNKPRINLKEGDEVKNCIECHKKASYIKGKRAKGLSKEKRREYQANAMHDNCKTCHKKFNKKKRLKRKDKGYAPNTCKTCHP